MTFEEFKATAKRELAADFAKRCGMGLDELGLETATHVRTYGPDNRHYISEETGQHAGKFWLVLNNADWLDSDLAKLERLLYDWAKDELPKTAAEARREALQQCFDTLTNYLLDHCEEDGNWEEFDPEIDGLRSSINELLEAKA
jgi:hypothetical protein